MLSVETFFVGIKLDFVYGLLLEGQSTGILQSMAESEKRALLSTTVAGRRRVHHALDEDIGRRLINLPYLEAKAQTLVMSKSLYSWTSSNSLRHAMRPNDTSCVLE